MQRTNYISIALRQLLLLALLVVCSNGAAAQAVAGWEKYYATDDFSAAYDCIQTLDEGFVIVGEDGLGDSYIVRTNPDGAIFWEKSYDLINVLDFGFKAVTRADNGFVAAGYTDNTGGAGSNDVFVVRLNEVGDALWTKTFGSAEDEEAFDVVATSDGGFAVVGFARLADGTKDIYLLKLNALGDTLWTQTYGTTYDDEGYAIIEASNTDLVITGYSEVNTNTPQTLFLRTNAIGEVLNYEQVGGTIGKDIVAGIDGGFTIAGRHEENGAIIKVTSGGVPSWTRFDFGGEFFDEFTSIVQTTDGAYILAGINEVSPLDIQAYVVKTDFEGLQMWEEEYGSTTNFIVDEFHAVTNTFDGGFAFVGLTSDVSAFTSNVYLTKINAEGQIFSDYIEGVLFYDVDGSNDQSAGDQPIEGWIIEAISDEHTCYGTSLADGSYSILVDTGMYDIQVRRPNDYWNSTSTIGFNIPNPDDTFDIDFAVQNVTLCSDLEVDISTGELIPGEMSEYKLTFCNQGTETANDPYVDVTFDEAFTITSTSPAFTLLGNGDLRFDQNIPDLAPFACFEITIDAILDAGLITGETHSVKAHAYPDEICTGGGDGSHLEVRAECIGDEVQLTIENTGTQAFTTASDYVIIEDMIMFQVPLPIPIEAGQEINLPRTANGSTYRICAPQAPNHPGDSRPTAAIEGCIAGGGSFSTGFVNQFTEDDYDHFLSVDCQENVSTVSPNSSRGYPKGYTAPDSIYLNEISPCIDLKFIHRFENTGPDTAIRVVIQDTLSPLLDPASVRPGASSHDYTMEVYGCGILRFTFDNIFLPNSSTDPEASQVFVKYRVSQEPNNASGATLNTSAAIYFDYQAPIKSDSIFHTIADGCDYEDYVIVNVGEIFSPEVKDIKVYPNPFHQVVTVEIVGDRILDQLDFVIYDLTGRIVRRESFNQMTFQLNRNNLASGMYVFKIESEGKPLSSGSIIIQ